MCFLFYNCFYLCQGNHIGSSVIDFNLIFTILNKKTKSSLLHFFSSSSLSLMYVYVLLFSKEVNKQYANTK